MLASTTVSGSQGLVEAMYVASPEYRAWKAYAPGVVGVRANPMTSTSPLPLRAVALELTVAAPVHVEFVNQSTVAIPVGFGLPLAPATCTKSWTEPPSPMTATAWCAAL